MRHSSRTSQATEWKSYPALDNTMPRQCGVLPVGVNKASHNSLPLHAYDSYAMKT